MRATRFIGLVSLWLVAILCAAWATGALFYDFPFSALRKPAAVTFVLVLLSGLIFLRGKWLKLCAVFVGFALVTCWWMTLKPSNDRPWQPDVAETAWADINGDLVTIHNVRNCDYRTETDYTPRWETRTVRLSQIAGVDLAITYWGSPFMAHPVACFRFNDALPISFSIEARKVIGQNFSPIASLYRQAQLIYVAADERDSVRVRAVYRQGEDVYLYRALVSPDRARGRFLEYVHSLNELHQHPRWYNVVTTNCTTNIREQHPEKDRIPWDWRILVNGKGDEMLYDHHLIATGALAFVELKRQSKINERARAADQDPEFSRRIREGLPGFEHD